MENKELTEKEIAIAKSRGKRTVEILKKLLAVAKCQPSCTTEDEQLEKIGRWLHTPTPGLGNEKPIALLASDKPTGLRIVERYVDALYATTLP